MLNHGVARPFFDRPMSAFSKIDSPPVDCHTDNETRRS
jgi:hypothetical protein